MEKITASAKHQLASTIASLIFLVGGFLAIVLWFGSTDIYYKHFFETGFAVVTYNLSRIVIGFFLVWIIYAVGYGTLAIVIPSTKRSEFTLSERIILGFGTGYGLWHIILLVLGILGLYYTSVMIGLCLAVLCASAPHFKKIMREISQCSIEKIRGLRQGESLIPIICGVLIIFGLVWLLMVRGLYPGGGGDYYTHYFYYYLDVIHNHGLKPNDVWYHYYYSKGAGLYFLGMLLMDPEAPEVVSFCCVAVATLALANLATRIAPRTLWPAFCVLLYLLYNLVPLSGNGGEFQKMHEQACALIIIATWALSLYHMRPSKWEKPTFITIASITIGIAIFSQGIAVLFSAFFAIRAMIALLKKNWRQMWYYGMLIILAGTTVTGIFLLNYLVTGLATDQALSFTWRFANLERLNQWGVLPDVLMTQWIRDHYETPAWGWDALRQLSSFMRIRALWIMIDSAIAVAVITFFWKHFQSSRNSVTLYETKTATLSVLITTTFIIGSFAVLSIFLGHGQAVTYFRFSSFFVPLLALFSTACWSVLIIQWRAHLSHDWILRLAAPVLLLTAVLFSWNYSWNHWFSRVGETTASATRFMTGQYSLATAYGDLHYGFSFGGINPEALQAMRQVPQGSRIWSTNVDSYCMAPNCRIESVFSFKLSSRLNEILNGPPENAKKILQEEGLNYFLISKDSMLLDMMPYSHLFNPTTLKQFFSIQWTDGKTYLLTWREQPNTQPIDKKFLNLYTQLLNKPEHRWFMFREALVEMDKCMKQINSSPHPWKPIAFPWEHQKSTGIDVTEATYGYSCRNFNPPSPAENYVAQGNATTTLKMKCNNQKTCRFSVTAADFGDPASGCSKDFSAYYRCPNSPITLNAFVPAEALGKRVTLDCRQLNGINVTEATYGSNCKFTWTKPFLYKVHASNATIKVQELCSGKKNCTFAVGTGMFGDPAAGCAKDFNIAYYCRSQNNVIRTIHIAKEAMGKHITLAC